MCSCSTFTLCNSVIQRIFLQTINNKTRLITFMWSVFFFVFIRSVHSSYVAFDISTKYLHLFIQQKTETCIYLLQTMIWSHRAHQDWWRIQFNSQQLVRNCHIHSSVQHHNCCIRHRGCCWILDWTESSPWWRNFPQLGTLCLKNLRSFISAERNLHS